MADIRSARRGRRSENNYLRAFLLGLGLAFIMFIPFIVVDGGRFLYYGDYNVQQVTFYRLAHDAIRSGNIGWSHLTDLGANFIGSYSFYLLGSPFFWLTIPFPSEWVQFLMGPLLILKIGCCSLTAYIYLQRYVRQKDYAILGALLYAFSGYSTFNIFFNHFHEAMVFFPLLLAAVDEYMYNRRRGVFGLAVAACCIVNYYFFVGMVVFCAIYWCLRMLCRSWTINLRDFIWMAMEAVLGLGMSCFLLMPSIYTVLQNYRVDNPINGWDGLVYTSEQRYWHILECFFFPPDIPARANFTPDSNAKWGSVAAWLPLFSMTGVLGWMSIRKKHWLKKLLGILFLMAFVPFLNAAFQMFNASYYARWFYMLTLVMALATILALDNLKIVNWKKAIFRTTLVTLGIGLAIGLMPKITTDEYDITRITIGVEGYPARFWSYVALALGSLALLALLFHLFKPGSVRFRRSVLASVAVVGVLAGTYNIALGKTQADYTWKHLIPYNLNGGEDVTIEDLDTVRSDFYESIDNAAMFWQIPSIQAFHSVVPGSIMEFYESIGVTRNVASRPDSTHYALRGLTSVRWLFDDDSDEKYFGGTEEAKPEMPGWVYYGNQNGYDIWENLYYIPMGFTYNQYVTEEEYEECTKSSREQLMLKAIVLSDEQVQKYGYLHEHGDPSSYVYSEEAYFNDCTARKEGACSEFEYTRTGFQAEISTEKSTLVFFSVPFEGGWSATVNGKPVDVEKVNVGFMAVEVPAGESKIVFTYKTPWLSEGILFSLFSLILFVAAQFLIRRYGKTLAVEPMRFSNTPRRARDFEEYEKETGSTFTRALYDPQREEETWPDLPVQLSEEPLIDLPPDLPPAQAPGSPAPDFIPPDDDTLGKEVPPESAEQAEKSKEKSDGV